MASSQDQQDLHHGSWHPWHQRDPVSETQTILPMSHHLHPHLIHIHIHHSVSVSTSTTSAPTGTGTLLGCQRLPRQSSLLSLFEAKLFFGRVTRFVSVSSRFSYRISGNNLSEGGYGVTLFTRLSVAVVAGHHGGNIA